MHTRVSEANVGMEFRRVSRMVSSIASIWIDCKFPKSGGRRTEFILPIVRAFVLVCASASDFEIRLCSTNDIDVGRT